VGEVIHSDVCGPFQVQGREGSNYYVTFIDDKSHFIAIYPIAKKNDVLAKFKEFAASLRPSSGGRLYGNSSPTMAVNILASLFETTAKAKASSS